MPGETRNKQSRKPSPAERRQRLAEVLRANLLKRKALARARQSHGLGPAPEGGRTAS
ncbi:MAG: hypothetical protein KJZ80_19095 [Hyphomicrobiaceae bacterium]|nr:hypothetical protein [Hyphomicrobiaceae bacterium]